MQTIIEFHQISHKFQDKLIFNRFTHVLNLHDKMGILRINTHKEKIFYQLIKNTLVPDSGSIYVNESRKIEFLDSSIDWDEEEVSLDYILKTSKQDLAICLKYSILLGFEKETLKLPIKKIPKEMRYTLKVISILAKEPDFLIIYEPIDFLNLLNQIFLENILKKYFLNKGFLIISNDYEILKNTCKSIHILEEEKLQPFIEKEENKKIKFYIKPLKNSNFGSIKRILNFLKKLYEKDLLKTHMEIRIPTLNSFNLEVNLVLKRNQNYALISSFKENAKEFLLTITGKTEPINGSYKWFVKNINYLSLDAIENLDKNINLKDLITFFSIGDASKLNLFFDLFNLQKIPLDVPIREIDIKTFYKIYIIFSILQNHEILILEEPEKYLNWIELKKFVLILKKLDSTIICYSNHRSFLKECSHNVLEVQLKKIYNTKKSPDEYFRIKSDFIKQEFKENLQKVIQYLIFSEKSQDTKKNGYIPFKVKNSEDLLSKKKALLLFFDKGYRERKREIASLKEELKKMEEYLKDLERKRDELWYYIDKYKLYTQENYDKMNKINKRLEELELKWYELQKKLEELEQQY
ncbi:MAG: hypothetical protein ACK4UJ_05360 [Leptonema sp. (in: bacteria)]